RRLRHSGMSLRPNSERIKGSYLFLDVFPLGLADPTGWAFRGNTPKDLYLFTTHKLAAYG
ncbi:MAG: hypothetical protein QXG73_01835, partial [Candidatus Micrarchaeaceae archaeon]